MTLLTYILLKETEFFTSFAGSWNSHNIFSEDMHEFFLQECFAWAGSLKFGMEEVYYTS